MGSAWSMKNVLGAAVVFGFMAALTLLFWIAIPAQNEQLITYMLGQLSGFVAAVIAFHYTMNSLNEKATANTGEMLRTMRAQAEAGAPPEFPAPPTSIPSPTFGDRL